MAAEPAPRAGAELFARPVQINQRRYEAMRAYLYEGVSLDEAAMRFGYTPATVASLVRDFRAGKLTLFAGPGRPGRKSSPKKDRARARVIELRHDGLSVYEISARLATEGTPLNRTGVGQILAEEGFGRLLRDPGEQASASPATSGRDTRLPRTSAIDFGAFPAHAHTSMSRPVSSTAPTAPSASSPSRPSWSPCSVTTSATMAPRRTGGCSAAPAAACSASRSTVASGTPPAGLPSARTWPPPRSPAAPTTCGTPPCRCG